MGYSAHSCQGMSEGAHKVYIFVWIRSYLWHDVPGTVLTRPSLNVISTKLMVSNGSNAREYLLSNDSS